MARATSIKSWLWHQRLSHLNFDTINDLAGNDLVTGLPKFKYHKEHLCPLCEQGKSKRASHPPKPVPNSKQRLHLLHMDLCGPMRIASINRKILELDLPYAPSTITTQKPTEGELDLLFEAMYDDHIGGQPSSAPRFVSATQVPQVLQTLTETTTTVDAALIPTNSSSQATTNVSTSFLIPNEDLSDDTTPSVARKFLNEVKSTILTLQRVVKQRMTIETHNWASSAHQELYKIIRDEIFPIVNQVDARLQNFEIQFLKEAAKFVGDFKSLANKADASLSKHKALELEIERLLKAVLSQDIMIIVQNESVVDTSDLQTELERTKERFENCIIKKENEYAKLWNDWYKKCDECKYDKISYDQVYKDKQQKIEQLQAQLVNLKGKSKDTTCVSDTRNPLSQKLENKNVELEFQLFKKVSDQKDNIQDSSANTKFAKQPIMENIPKVGKINALSKPITSNSVSIPQESKGVNNDKVITLGMFRINPDKTSRESKKVPNSVSASARTKPITVSQPPIITKKDVNSDVNGL
nr:retrovirus-related Pol polyprotein from transposon TNT 1-94 [Tanacetum cinerariifolium]